MGWRKLGTTHKKVEVKEDYDKEKAWQKIGMIKMKVESKPDAHIPISKLEAQINAHGDWFRAMIVDGSGKSVMKDLSSLKKAKAWADSKIKQAKQNRWTL